jgi:hypothetical protein
MNTYKYLTNTAGVTLLAVLIVGAFGLTGCSIEGDVYSGVVVDCSASDSGGGLLNCGSGAPTDDHHSEEIAAE